MFVFSLLMIVVERAAAGAATEIILYRMYNVTHYNPCFSLELMICSLLSAVCCCIVALLLPVKIVFDEQQK